jgi:glyoxylase-like metal-dependent hydrolase (beta-lactamase superfamily II)
MLKQVADGVLGHEMAALADDLRKLGQPVVAGFSTHPHWDHLLWHARLGAAPRYGTARCAATALDRLSDPGAKARLAGLIPPDIAGQVPLDLLGLITGLPAGTAQIPWDGPEVRIIEHQAHAPGHAALLIGERGVLVPGHGSIGGPDQVPARIGQDRAYVHAVRDAGAPSDPRLGPSATYGDWLPGVHARQLQRLAQTSERGETPG